MDRQQEFSRSPLFIAKGLLIIISLAAGMLGGFFCIWKDNYYGTTSFLSLELVSALLCRLYYNQMKGEIFPTYSKPNMRCLVLMGGSMFIVFFIFSIFLIVMGIKYETEFNFIDDNCYFALLPSLLSSFWNVVLVYEARNFVKLPDELFDTDNAQKNVEIPMSPP